MKKNLVFVIPSLTAAGGEKSLVSLLSQIDYDLFNVDLFLLKHDGMFMKFVPKEVNILSLPESYKLFTLPLFNSMTKLLLKGKIKLFYNRMIFTLRNRFSGNISIKEQHNWKYLASSLNVLQKQYDVAIGFLEKTSIYFCVEKVNALQKIGWIHIDYDKLGMDSDFDIKYFKKLDQIITVSEECGVTLEKRFPQLKKKIKVIYNIVSPTMINNMANQESIDVYKKKDNEIIILSIGRLHYQKGFDLAIASCKLLIERGYNIKWHIIGEGEERRNLTNLIKKNKLEKNVILLGLKANPYPFIKQADIYAQTSKFEGKSIAIDEAKILNKPIIVTNFSTAKDQINNGIDGLIVDLEPAAFADGIEKLINDRRIREKFEYNLSTSKLGTEEEINKLYEILN